MLYDISGALCEGITNIFQCRRVELVDRVGAVRLVIRDLQVQVNAATRVRWVRK
jgi:hypothetical protein